jgi:fatty acid desaturase
MIDDIMAMFVMAGIGAMISFIILAFSRRAKAKRSVALQIQAACILGLGFLFLLGAGLQSPPGYPHWLIPIVFIVVLIFAHLVWRVAYPNDHKSSD